MRRATDDEIRGLLSSKNKDWIESRIKAMKDEVCKKRTKVVEDSISRQREHDELMLNCISAFSPNQACSQRTGYGFVTSEPLIEKGVKNFDLLFLNEQQEVAIFVECKTSSSNWPRTVKDVMEAIAVRNREIRYLESEIGCHITHTENVICVPSSMQIALSREIERQETEGIIDVANDDLLLIWGIHMFGGTPKLQLFTKLDSSRDEFQNHHRDGGLSKMLADGVPFDCESVAPVFPSSHPMKIALQVVTWILRDNYINGRELCDFDKGVPVRYFNDSRNLPHYARSAIGAELASRFIREGFSFGLIEQKKDNPSMLGFSSKGKTIPTIIKNFRNRYLESLIEISTREECERLAVEEFLETQKTLEGYE